MLSMAVLVLSVCITDCTSDGLVWVLKIRFRVLQVVGFDLR